MPGRKVLKMHEETGGENDRDFQILFFLKGERWTVYGVINLSDVKGEN